MLQQMDGCLRLPMSTPSDYLGEQGRMQYDSFDDLAAAVEKLWKIHNGGLED